MFTILRRFAAIIFVIALSTFGCRRETPAPTPPSGQKPLTHVKLAGTPHQDTTMFLWAMKHRLFRQRGIELDIRDTTFNEQIEFAGGGGCDIAMGTVDELASKSKNLNAARRRVVYLMPAWLFEGQIFVSRPDLRSLAELKRQFPPQEAARKFFDQLRGKTIAVPEGSSYDQALRRLMRTHGYDPGKFRFVNTQLEAGINGLGDPNVAIAAAGIVERPEAEKRGYKVALDSLDLEMIVIAGFVAQYDFYQKNREAVDKFLLAWFESVKGGLANPQEEYGYFKEYLSARGAKVPTFEEYERALRYTRFAKSPADVKAIFLDPTAPANWRKPWDARVQQMKEQGQADQVPADTSDFIADEVVARLQKNGK